MPTILIVDDAATDRRLAGAFLKKDDKLSIEYAVHGLDALEMLSTIKADLVVTDLMMPEMDGLELVAAVRDQYPLIPVILMTSLGSEEIAVRALQQGAASYVPKSTLVSDLLDTVHRVLSVSSQRRSEARMMKCITYAKATFELENDTDLIPPLVGYLQESITQLDVCGEAERVRVGVALEEALTNALYHGNLEVRSELREDESDAYYSLARERTSLPPYADRRIRVETDLSRDEAVFVIRDEGPGFDPSMLPDPTDPVNLEKLSGRGVLLMRTFMDEVTFNEAGNQVTMIKRRVLATGEESVVHCP